MLRRLAVSVLVATADPDDAATLADDTAVIELGRVTQVGATSTVLAQRSVSVAALAGYETLLQGRAEGDRVSELGVGSVELPAGVPRDEIVHLMAHPAGILAVPRGHGLGTGVTGTVAYSRPLGPLWLLEVTLGSRSTLLVRWEWDREPPGERVELAAAGVRLYVGTISYGARGTDAVAPEVLTLQAAPFEETPPAGLPRRLAGTTWRVPAVSPSLPVIARTPPTPGRTLRALSDALHDLPSGAAPTSISSPSWTSRAS
jgi:hypothetical protein